MHNSRLIVICTASPVEPDAACADVLRDWPGGAPPMHVVTLQDVIDRAFVPEPGAVVWARVPDADRAHVFELLDRLFDAQTAAVIESSLSQEWVAGDGVVALPADASDQSVCVALQSMWTQSQTVAGLRAEAAMLKRQQASAAKQMTLIVEELRRAAQLQRQFVAETLPTLAGVSFNVMWRPASYVSGDIYEVFRLDEHHLGIFVADAVGHGVPAALMTMYIKRSLPTKKLDPDAPRGYRIVPPAEAIAALNHDLYAQQHGQTRFATACYGVLDTRDLSFRFARAGHPYPALLRTDGTTLMIEADGGLLGLFEEDDFEEVTVQLRHDDRLLIYSDGFEVAFPEPDSDKIANEVYLDVFESFRDGCMDDHFVRLEGLIESSHGSLNPRDDLTLIAMSLAEVAPQETEPHGEASRAHAAA